MSRPTYDRIGADATPLIETARRSAERDMAKLKAMNIFRGFECETEIRVGPTIDEISGQSGRSGVDLLVTSTHGRTGFKHALIGSVAEHLVRYAECPVITVPSRGRFYKATKKQRRQTPIHAIFPRLARPRGINNALRESLHLS